MKNVDVVYMQIPLSAEAKRSAEVLVDGISEMWNVYAVLKSITVWQLPALRNFDRSHIGLSTLFFKFSKNENEEA